MVLESLLPRNISNDAFHELLDQYSPLIESVSSSKAPKAGQKTLLELDEFRYREALKLFGSESPEQAMNHDHVKELVDWKLRHGKFRPTLMKLVSSNDGDMVKETMEKALNAYWKSPDAFVALGEISKLKGIGPATASLLLSVHDPDRVIFFSDEAFWWLCCDGEKAPIKYNSKEYQELNQSAQELVSRLSVSATDVEKVAYVVMKDGGLPAVGGENQGKPSTATPAVQSSKKGGAKRKEEPATTNSPDPPVRRSKRGKAS
ncbi:DUF1479 domain protein [Seiridium cupressi]